MTSEPLPRATEPDYLTDALRRSGALSDGRVTDAVVETTRKTVLSRIIRLRLSYDGAVAGVPSFMILKTGLPERIDARWDSGRQEVAFYTQVAATMSAPLVPRCFDAAWDPDTKAWHLLLEDLTESHTNLPPLPPTFDQSKRIIAARARFHAAWWDDHRLGVSIGAWLDPRDPQLQRFAEEVARFADRVGDRLSAERRDLYHRLIDAGHRLNQRYHAHHNMTIVQGDAHVWNVLLPQDASSEDVRLLDWDSWRLDVGTDDLAYMMALHWFPDHRRRSERQLLDHYHATLLAHGVGGYDRRAL